MRCISCKKEEDALFSHWDRFRLFLFGFFHQDIIDLSDEKFTKGFGEGYQAGYEASKKDAYSGVGKLQDMLQKNVE